MSIGKPIITHEHGSWSVLFVPLITGAAYAKTISWNSFFLTLSALGVFLSYLPAQTILRNIFSTAQKKEKLHASYFWIAVYAGIAFCGALPLLMQKLWGLSLFAAAGVLSFLANFYLTQKIQKSIPGDLAAVFGLTLSAPAAYYAETSLLNETAVLLWILNVLFFGSSVFYVHMKLHAVKMKKPALNKREKLSAGKLNILYHIAVIVIVCIFVMFHFTRAAIIIAYLPMFVHAMYGTLKLSAKVKFKNLGFLLLGQSTLFAIICIYLR